jgi:hypothetical protein
MKTADSNYDRETRGGRVSPRCPACRKGPSMLQELELEDDIGYIDERAHPSRSTSPLAAGSMARPPCIVPPKS